MVSMAESERPVSALPEDLEANVFLLNVRNGMLDLKTTRHPDGKLMTAGEATEWRQVSGWPATRRSERNQTGRDDSVTKETGVSPFNWRPEIARRHGCEWEAWRVGLEPLAGAMFTKGAFSAAWCLERKRPRIALLGRGPPTIVASRPGRIPR
jgi:hypothetical protein